LIPRLVRFSSRAEALVLFCSLSAKHLYPITKTLQVLRLAALAQDDNSKQKLRCFAALGGIAHDALFHCEASFHHDARSMARL
jgi:hypothetical protein